MTYTFVNETDLVTSVINDLFTTIEASAKAEGLALDFIFPSTASATQKPLLSYGAANFRTIEEAARKYDPRGYMQRLQNDGYLISNES